MNNTMNDDVRTFAQEMATLSAIAYCTDSAAQLAKTDYATKGEWSIWWGPATSIEGNYAFIVEKISTGDFALVVRGTMNGLPFQSIENWINDLRVDHQERCDDLSDCAKISAGAKTQARNLWGTWSDGATLETAMRTLPPGARLFVTGHSLGGNLASVLAPHASVLRHGELPDADSGTIVYTFAAPTAGNTFFADEFNVHFPESRRYWNSLDIVPDAWANLAAIEYKYLPDLSCPNPVLVRGLTRTVADFEDAQNSYYGQTNGEGTVLPGRMVPLLLQPPAFRGLQRWDVEALVQHSCNTYLDLLGAPIIRSATFVEFAP